MRREREEKKRKKRKKPGWALLADVLPSHAVDTVMKDTYQSPYDTINDTDYDTVAFCLSADGEIAPCPCHFSSCQQMTTLNCLDDKQHTAKTPSRLSLLSTSPTPKPPHPLISSTVHRDIHLPNIFNPRSVNPLTLKQSQRWAIEPSS